MALNMRAASQICTGKRQALFGCRPLQVGRGGDRSLRWHCGGRAGEGSGGPVRFFSIGTGPAPDRTVRIRLQAPLIGARSVSVPVIRPAWRLAEQQQTKPGVCRAAEEAKELDPLET